MTNPCTQEINISNIHHVLERMERASEEDRRERRESEKQIMAVLEKLADQGARIVHLEDHISDGNKHTEHMEDRMRNLEIDFEKIANFHNLIWSTPAKYIYGLLFATFNLLVITDLISHWTILKNAIIQWFKITNGASP